MDSLSKFIKSLTYNHFLGALIFICCFLLLLNANKMAAGLEVAVSDVVTVVVACGVLVFGFFGHFYTVTGAVFKTLSFLVISVIIIYATSGIENNNILLIVRVSVGLFVLFGLYGAVNAVRSAAKEDDFMENGYELDATFKEVKCINTGEVYLFSILTTAQHPETGEVLTFESEETFKDLEHSVHDGDVFKIYLDKKNPKKYIFNLPD